jgi:SNF2-related domain
MLHIPSSTSAINYQPKFPRWKHQDEALRLSRSKNAFALFMEMRTGKTKCVLDEFGEFELRGEIKHLLVVAPAGVYRTWEVDAEKHLSDDLKRRVKILRWVSSSPAARQDVKQAIKTKGPKILLVNIEALSTVEDAQRICAQFIRSAPTMMVVDESTVIKSRTANRTKFCLAAARHCKMRRILSGLPSPQSPLDLFTQMWFLDPRILGFSRYSDFQERYAVTTSKPFGPGGRSIKVVSGYQNLDELSRKILTHAYRVKLSDCYDLPPKQYLPMREVALTNEQQRLYNEMKTYATTVLNKAGERVTATIVLTQLLRLHQILVGHTTSDNGEIIDIPEHRTAELLHVLGEHSGKAVIWAAYSRDIRKLTAAIQNVYGIGSVARFWGDNRNEREDEEKRFLNNPKCRYMIATAASGGRGRTWANADLVVYHSNTFSLEHRLQSEERPQAVGKTTSVAYLDLICRNTVEEKILHTLRHKMRLSDAVTGDKWRSWVV